MKVKAILLIFALSTGLLTGCATQPNAPAQPSPAQATPTSNSNETPDTVTTASIVDNAQAFESAISSNNGTWIICLTKDITTDKELVLDGEYKNGKKDDEGKDIIQRKIALYAQDEDRKVTARYTLTAPKLTIKSPMASVQRGTFKGDLYVSSNNFELVDAKIEGNIYFTTDEAKSTFKIDDKSSVTGKQEVKKP